MVLNGSNILQGLKLMYKNQDMPFKGFSSASKIKLYTSEVFMCRLIIKMYR